MRSWKLIFMGLFSASLCACTFTPDIAPATSEDIARYKSYGEMCFEKNRDCKYSKGKSEFRMLFNGYAFEWDYLNDHYQNSKLLCEANGGNITYSINTHKTAYDVSRNGNMVNVYTWAVGSAGATNDQVPLMLKDIKRSDKYDRYRRAANFSASYLCNRNGKTFFRGFANTRYERPGTPPYHIITFITNE